MKKYILVLIGIAITYCSAQVIPLPDVEITAESPIRAYLYKHSIRYNTNPVSYDSVAPFLPALSPITFHDKRFRTSQTVRGYARLSIDTDTAQHLSVAYIPSQSSFDIVSADLLTGFYPKDKTKISFALSALANIQSSKILPTFSMAHNTSQIVDNDILAFDLYHSIDSISITSVSLGDIHNRIGISDLRSKRNQDTYHNTNYYLYHESRIKLGKQAVMISGYTGRDDQAIAISYAIEQNLLPFDNLELGLATNFSNLIPTICFNVNPWIGKNRYLRLKSEFALTPHYDSDYIQTQPWIDLRNESVVSLSIFDISADYSTDLNIGQIQDIKLWINSAYRTGNPIPVIKPGENHDSISFHDIYSNSIGGEARLIQPEGEFIQHLEINLDYLPTDSFRRLPYKPLIKSLSTIMYRYNDINFKFNLHQNYFIRNQAQETQKPDIDLSVSAAYQLSNSIAINGKLLRIFGSKARKGLGLPIESRTIWLGASYYF